MCYKLSRCRTMYAVVVSSAYSQFRLRITWGLMLVLVSLWAAARRSTHGCSQPRCGCRWCRTVFLPRSFLASDSLVLVCLTYLLHFTSLVRVRVQKTSCIPPDSAFQLQQYFTLDSIMTLLGLFAVRGRLNVWDYESVV